MSNPIKLLTLDLDNTLWDVDAVIIRAEQDMRTWMAEHAPGSLEHYTAEQLPLFRQTVVERFPDKVHDLSFMRTEVLHLVMSAAGYDNTAARGHAEQAFDVFFHGRNRVEFYDGALDALDELSQQYPIVALTNGNADIERAGLGNLLSGAISSADVGKSKPSPDMFVESLSRHEIDPHEAIHIGDNLVDDIHGAREVGMHTIWVNLQDAVRSDEDAVPHQEISHLDQLTRAVAAIADDAAS